jgi:hypothetical protein
VKYRFSYIAVVLLLLCRAVSADTLDVVGGDSSWHAWQTPATSGGTAFWNNSSYDNNHACNIGYWLSGTGGCAAGNGTFMANSPKVTANYLGDSTTGFQMTKSADTQSVTVSARVQVTAYAQTDEFGWFDLGAPTVLNKLFTGVGIVGTSATFVPSGTYGFYLRSPEGTYLSTGVGDTTTHFAVFQLAGNDHYMVGTEDMWKFGDWDYNDVVFDVQANGGSVPEPATMMLLGTGVAGIGAAARRRRRSR